MATIIELAKKAGVSKTTVSRYLNGEAKGHISLETQKRIKDAIKELNYRPNDLARGLKQKKTNVIGIVINDLSNPFFLQMIKGIEPELQAAGYNMMICNSDMNIKREIELLKMLDQKRMDGIIVIGMNMTTEHVKELEIHVPIVLFERDAGETGYDSIQIDNETGVELAVHHLVEKGYQRIAHIEGAKGSVISRERSRSFRKAMEKYGRKVPDEYLVSGDYKLEVAYEAMENLCRLATPPDAVFCSNDSMALGAVRYLIEHHYRIPEDVAIVGYDDIEMAALVTPALTTIRQPARELSKRGTKMLLERIQNPEGNPDKPRNVILKPELMIRKSS